MLSAAELVPAVEGLALALIVCLPLSFFRVLSVRELSLLTIIGVLAGPRDWLAIFLFSGLIGVPIALRAASSKTVRRKTGATTSELIRRCLPFLPPFTKRDDRLSSQLISGVRAMGVAIGVLCFLVSKALGLI